MNRGVIPEHLHFRNPNPEMGLGAAPIAGDIRLDAMARPLGPPAARGGERVRMVGHERPCRAGGIHLPWRCHARPPPMGTVGIAGAPRPIAVSIPTSVASPRRQEALAPRTTRLLLLSGKSEAALRDVAARYLEWLDGHGDALAAENAASGPPALGHGLDGRHRPEPLRPSDRSGVPGRGVAARGSAGDRRDRRESGIAQGDEGGVRLYRAGQPVAGHGRGALRKRAGGPRGARPVRRGARGTSAALLCST